MWRKDGSIALAMLPRLQQEGKLDLFNMGVNGLSLTYVIYGGVNSVNGIVFSIFIFLWEQNYFLILQ